MDIKEFKNTFSRINHEKRTNILKMLYSYRSLRGLDLGEIVELNEIK